MTLEEITEKAIALSEKDRAELARYLLATLPAPPDLVDADDGLAEAKRRSRELDETPEMAISWEQLKKELGRD